MRAELRQVDYIASYRPDNTSESGPEGSILERFGREEGGLDVVVNVQMMTEGVNVPAIQAVFLARPTTSEILLRQMIGRGLRGPKVGGTETAYIVSFEDHWRKFRDWESPLDFVADIIPPVEKAPEDRSRAPRVTDLVEVLDWEIVKSTISRLRQRGLRFRP